MPSFDVTSEVDLQEVRNAVDQAAREVATRFDFKNTGASLELSAHEITLHAPTEDRLRALVQVLEEKLVRRQDAARRNRALLACVFQIRSGAHQTERALAVAANHDILRGIF